MSPDEILEELRRLRIPHEKIGEAIGRDRSAATKMLKGYRSIKATEIGPLTALIQSTWVEALRNERTAIREEEAARHPEELRRRAQYERSQRPPLQHFGKLPIRGDVRAGAWLEVNQLDQREVEQYPAAPDPRYPRARQWLSVVRGDSMNALTKGSRPAGILEGDLVHVVDAIDIDYRPVSGDIVEVERSRFDGAEREVTIKQIGITEDGVMLLWPRSTNPAFQEPLPLIEDGDTPERSEVRIRGKVLQVLRPF